MDEHGRALAGRAAERLAAAAERAMAREDRRAQVNLLSRAVALLPVEDRRRLELLPELGLGLARLGEFARSEAVLSEAIDAAVRLGDARVAARARVARVWPHTSIEPGDVAEQLREGERAIRVFEQAGDELGLSGAWDLLASLHHAQGQSAAAQEAWERSIEHARRAGSRRDELSGLTWLPSVAVWGPTPAADARRRCEEILEQVKGDLLAETDVLSEVGCLHAIEGRFDEARALHARRAAMYAELGLELEAALLSYAAGWVEMLAGDAAAAERVVRPAYQTLERMGARGELQVVGSYLAQAIYMQGRYQEAERLALSVEELDPAGIAEVAYARCARAKAAAKLGRAGEGARLAREAVALVDRTDFLIDRGEARMDLAEVLRLAGRSDEAADVLGEALRLHEKKGNVVSAERARALLAELGR